MGISEIVVLESDVIFCRLDRSVRRAIGEFQDYVSAQVRARTAKWTLSKKLIQSIAEELAQGPGSARLPMRLKPIATALCTAVNVEPQQSSRQDGELTPVEGGFRTTIFVAEVPSDGLRRANLWGGRDDASTLQGSFTHRQRFTLAHELGHVFFYHTPKATAIPRRLIPPARTILRADWREEGLCHDFARAILIPATCRPQIPSTPTLQSLFAAAATFEVAQVPMLYRLLHDWNHWTGSSFSVVSRVGCEWNVKCFHSKGAIRPPTWFTSNGIRHLLRDASDLETAVGIFRRQQQPLPLALLATRSAIWLQLQR